MGADDVLTGGLVALAGFVLVALPWLLAAPVARWLTRQAEARLGPAAYRRRDHGPATEWVLVFLGVEPYGRRHYGPGARAVPGRMAGAVVELGGGVGPAHLGMSPAQVEAALGRSLGYDTWDDGNLNDSLIYDGVRLSIDRCDHRGPLARSRLCVAEVRRADAVLLGRPLAGWGEGELAAELVQRGLRPQVSEPGYAEFAGPYLAAWFEAGRLVRVEVAA